MMRFIIGIFLICSCVFSGELKILAAANLKNVLEKIKEEFSKDYPDEQLNISYLASGKAYAQIKNGLDVDIFFSADAQKPQKLFQEGFGLLEPEIYALGKLVVFSAHDINLSTDHVFSSSEVRHIAIANPKLAPYGEAAITYLKEKKLYEKLQSKLVLGDSANQAFLYVKSNNAEVGLNALSLVIADPTLSYRILDERFYSPIKQAFLILKSTKNEKVARAFVRFVMSDEGQSIFETYGYGRYE